MSRYIFSSDKGQYSFGPLFVTSLNSLASITQTFFNYGEPFGNMVRISSMLTDYLENNGYDRDTPFVGTFCYRGPLVERYYQVDGQGYTRHDCALVVFEDTIGRAKFDTAEGDSPWNMQWIKDNLEELNEEYANEINIIFGGFVNQNMQE